MALKDEWRKQGDLFFKYRSYWPVILLFPAFYLYIHKELSLLPAEEFRSDVLEYISFGLCLVGLGIRMYAVGYSAKNTSGRNTKVGQVADTINKRGLYSVCRHPLYLANFLMWFGLAAFTQHAWFIFAFVLIYALYYERIMYAEESFLIEKYKDEYLTYARSKPAILPKLKLWEPPTSSFNWIKVINQEKSGILNLFLIIVLLRTAAEWAEGQLYEVELFWILGLSLSILLYIVLKIMKPAGLQK